MTKTAMIRARIEPELKEEVDDIFNKLGLNVTEAINLYYRQIKLQQGIPFEIKIPNAKTRRTVKDAREGKGKKFDSVGNLLKNLKS